MAEPIQRPIGTRDFGPDEMAARNHFASRLKHVFHRFGYHEVATPTFEELHLFTAKSGVGIISELYNFKDKGDRDLTLRPELTAPVMRMYFQEHFNDPKPLKWFYFGPCYRYDRPQAGRYREFWQFGCEQIGAGTPLAYAELIALGDAVVAEAGVKKRDLSVGHVKILKACVETFGFDAATRGHMMRAIDKKNRAEIQRLADKKGGCELAVDRLFLIMDAPTVGAARNAMLDEMKSELDELEATMKHLESFGVKVKLDLGIARGLDYYTGIVFEMHSSALGAQSQLLGGGGYDLSAVFGGQPTPTMGFGMGFDRTLVALEAEGHKLPTAAGPTVAIGALSEAAQRVAVLEAAKLRAAGVATDLDLMGRKVQAIAKWADGIGAKFLVIIGDRDLQSGTVEVKELKTGNVRKMPVEQLVKSLA